jgi:hypothetical protein
LQTQREYRVWKWFVHEYRQTIYDASDEKNGNVSFEGLDIHYWTRCHASENVCLDLQNCHYSVFIGQWNNHLHFMNLSLLPIDNLLVG